VRITAAGRRALKAVMPAVTKSEARILDALPQRMRADFIKCLLILAKAANELLTNEDGSRAKGRKRR
jgi:DNA-binding MarR family transcriptional regulator